MVVPDSLQDKHFNDDMQCSATNMRFICAKWDVF